MCPVRKGLIQDLNDDASDELRFDAEEQFLNTATELLFGAQETTACTITCALLLLFNNPTKLSKLRSEIDHMTDNNNTPQTQIKYIPEMTYLDKVIKEVLRMSPPIGGGYRQVLRTFQLGVSRKI